MTSISSMPPAAAMTGRMRSPTPVPMPGRGDDDGASFESARAQASQLVSMALVQPMLEEVRRSSMAAGPFAAGDVEKHFGPMLDQHLSSAFGNRGDMPLIDAVARRLSRDAAPAVPVARGAMMLSTPAQPSPRPLLPLDHDPMAREAMSLAGTERWRAAGPIDLGRNRAWSLEAYR